MLSHLSLFSGIGGIDLAAEWAGFTTVGQVEMADYPTKVLEKHWPNVPRWRDVRDVSRESFYGQTGLQTVDLVSGGFPCQPFSVAGKRRGKEDDRYLWPEMFRVISELRPTWVLGENVAGFVSLGLDNALSDLESIGYQARTFIVPAAGVGAWHRRDRVFIVAYAQSIRLGIRRPESERQQGKLCPASGCTSPGNVGNTECGGCDWQSRWWSREVTANGYLQSKTQFICHTTSEGLPDWSDGTVGQPNPLTEFERPDGREIERDFRGVAHGVSRRVDRLRGLGNAVVPQQVYPLLWSIANILREERQSNDARRGDTSKDS